jgi:hypothetical protein
MTRRTVSFMKKLSQLRREAPLKPHAGEAYIMLRHSSWVFGSQVKAFHSFCNVSKSMVLVV